MKKVSLFALALSTTAATWASAQAPAPVAVPVAQPCPCPKAFQGFHLGGNVGYGIGFSKNTFEIPGTTSNYRNEQGVRGFDGGLNVGYTHRFNNFGLGLEGVFTWASTKGHFNNVDDGFKDKLKLNNSIQLRANLSYVICNLVAPKIILGWDNSQWRRTTSVTPTGGETTKLLEKKKRLNGFLWGAGVDFLLAKHVIAGFEYTGTYGGKLNVTNAVDSVGNRQNFTTKPQYNKFALVVKFIY